MADSTLLVKVTVIGCIIASALGQSFVFSQNLRQKPQHHQSSNFANAILSLGRQFLTTTTTTTTAPTTTTTTTTLPPGVVEFAGMRVKLHPKVQELATASPEEVEWLATHSTTPAPTTTTLSPPQRRAKQIFDAMMFNYKRRMASTTTTTTTTTTPSPTAMIGNAQGTHTHPFLGQPEDGDSRVIVHSHGQDEKPHVHISHEESSYEDEVRVTRQQVPNVLSAAPGAPNSFATRPYNQLRAPGTLREEEVSEYTSRRVPQFLTGGNTEVETYKQMDTELTELPKTSAREQILPPYPPTQAYTPENESLKEEQNQGRAFTQMAPPDSQIKAPRSVIQRAQTTSQEPRGTSADMTSSASTPTTLPGLDPTQGN